MGCEDWTPPQPGPQHEKLLESVGEWHVDCKHFMDPSQPPMESTATDTVRAIGGFWTVSDFKGEAMGMPFEGCSTVGYDVIREKYVTTWVDSMMPNHWYMEGDFETDDTMVFTGKGPSHTGDGLIDWKISWEMCSKDKHIMRMFVCTPEGDMMTMENTYTRK